MRRGDGGFGLLETLIALTILSIGVVAIAGGMGASIFGSNRHRDQAEAHALVIQAAENIRSSSLAYVPCADPATSSYLAAARNVSSLPTGWSTDDITIVSIKRYTGTGFETPSGTCVPPVPGDPFALALQLVQVQVSSPDGGDVERISVVKGP